MEDTVALRFGKLGNVSKKIESKTSSARARSSEMATPHIKQEAHADKEEDTRDVLTYREVEAEYNIPLGTLYSMVSRRQIPHLRISKRFVRFRRRELEAWLQAATVPISTAR